MSEIRLSGGRFRGRRLRVPHGVRPTEGRVREALFSIWQGELPESRFLDLFAGSGAVGLEALGRGASAVVLVEGDPRVERAADVNAGSLAAARAVRGYRMRLPAGLAVLREREAPFDLVFADPPVRFPEAGRAPRRGRAPARRGRIALPGALDPRRAPGAAPHPGRRGNPVLRGDLSQLLPSSRHPCGD